MYYSEFPFRYTGPAREHGRNDTHVRNLLKHTFFTGSIVSIRWAVDIRRSWYNFGTLLGRLFLPTIDPCSRCRRREMTPRFHGLCHTLTTECVSNIGNENRSRKISSSAMSEWPFRLIVRWPVDWKLLCIH